MIFNFIIKTETDETSFLIETVTEPSVTANHIMLLGAIFNKNRNLKTVMNVS